MDNTKLQQAVRDELAADPKIDHREVAVSVGDDGVVNLRGTVGSLRQRREAAEAAKRVFGVQEVKNNLDVRPLDWRPARGCRAARRGAPGARA